MRPKRRTTRKVRMRRITLMGMSTGPSATREREMTRKSKTDQPSLQKGWNLPGAARARARGEGRGRSPKTERITGRRARVARGQRMLDGPGRLDTSRGGLIGTPWARTIHWVDRPYPLGGWGERRRG
jgi:hypothetical protein